MTDQNASLHPSFGLLKSASFIAIILFLATSLYVGCLFIAFKKTTHLELEQEVTQVSSSFQKKFRDLQEVVAFLVWRLERITHIPANNLSALLGDLSEPGSDILPAGTRLTWVDAPSSHPSEKMILEKIGETLRVHQSVAACQGQQNGHLIFEIPLHSLLDLPLQRLQIQDMTLRRISGQPETHSDSHFVSLGNTPYVLHLSARPITHVSAFLHKYREALGLLALLIGTFGGMLSVWGRLSMRRTYTFLQDDIARAHDLKMSAEKRLHTSQEENSHLSRAKISLAESLERRDSLFKEVFERFRVCAEDVSLKALSISKQESEILGGEDADISSFTLEKYHLLGSPQLSVFPAEEILDSTLSLFSYTLAEKKIALTKVNHIKHVSLETDRLILEILLVNLINARLTLLPPRGIFQIALRQQRGVIIFQLTDNSHEPSDPQGIFSSSDPHFLLLSAPELERLRIKIGATISPPVRKKDLWSVTLQIPINFKGLRETEPLNFPLNVIPFPGQG